MGRRREHARALGLLAAVLCIAAGPHARPANAGNAQALSDRARSVLEAHCADCRREGSAVDLGALAESPRLVVPGRPDASRVYQRLFAAKPGETPATPEEIEVVRDWIESLPAPDQACRDRTPVTPADIETKIDHWTGAVGLAEAKDTRFLSLAHLWNACVPAERLRDYREATASLLGAIARSREPLAMQTLGDESVILAVRIRELALVTGEWERLTAEAPIALSEDAVPADWLAARVRAGVSDASGNPDPAFEVKLDGAAQRAVDVLADVWTKDVDLARASAERGASSRALAARLTELEGDAVYPAQRLIHGVVSRADWETLSRVLDGETENLEWEKRKAPEGEIDVQLWTDKPRYWPRDLVTINASVSSACHLTLINVDREGKAIVLFPNDIEQDNLVAPGVAVRVPGRDANYQFRFDRSGEEQIVGICQRQQRRPDGIDYDYEKQRFEILGDWRTFLRTASTREQELRARREAEAARRKRRGGRAPVSAEPAPIDPDGPPLEGRAAITVPIDLAGGAAPAD